MGKTGKITREQLRSARRILRDLPVKDTRCSREGAAVFLEKDFKRAFTKGYTPKELCALLKKARIIIPERLIARYQEPVEEAGENGDFKPEEQGGRDERSSIVPSQKIEGAEMAKDTTPSSENEAKPTPKPEPIRYGTFMIVPDTPIGDL